MELTFSWSINQQQLRFRTGVVWRRVVGKNGSPERDVLDGTSHSSPFWRHTDAIVQYYWY